MHEYEYVCWIGCVGSGKGILTALLIEVSPWPKGTSSKYGKQIKWHSIFEAKAKV